MIKFKGIPEPPLPISLNALLEVVDLNQQTLKSNATLIIFTHVIIMLEFSQALKKL